MNLTRYFRAQELCESRGGRRELPVPNCPYCLCGCQATLKKKQKKKKEEEEEEEEEGHIL